MKETKRKFSSVHVSMIGNAGENTGTVQRLRVNIQHRLRYGDLGLPYLGTTQVACKRAEMGLFSSIPDGISKDPLDAQVRRDRRQAPPSLHVMPSPATKVGQDVPRASLARKAAPGEVPLSNGIHISKTALNAARL